jgi:hypothetical protein
MEWIGSDCKQEDGFLTAGRLVIVVDTLICGRHVI